MTAIVETSGLGKRYGRKWALRDLDLTIPEGKVVGLIGPNGAGKTTLLNLMVGLLSPTAGTIHVQQAPPAHDTSRLNDIGFVAQNTPLYARTTVEQHDRMGRMMNPRWDSALVRTRMQELDIDMRQRTGTLSGGQRAQVALALAVAKQPRLLVLDEPVASLDPLARREFMQTLMEMFTDRAFSVILSSHLVDDLSRVADHMIVLVGSRVRLSGDVTDILESHVRLSGPKTNGKTLPSTCEVIDESHTERQSTFLVRTDVPIIDPKWTTSAVTMEDIAIAYMEHRQPAKRELEALA
jgi:ABC-2 type transport system ATP-binding protein